MIGPRLPGVRSLVRRGTTTGLLLITLLVAGCGTGSDAEATAP
jgi:hypothetical protein